jgi:hypothetical protein
MMAKGRFWSSCLASISWCPPFPAMVGVPHTFFRRAFAITVIVKEDFVSHSSLKYVIIFHLLRLYIRLGLSALDFELFLVQGSALHRLRNHFYASAMNDVKKLWFLSRISEY